MAEERTVQTDTGDQTKESSVHVIEPNLPAEAAIRRVEPSGNVTCDDVRVVGYPKFLFDYCCSLHRAFLSDREVPVSITVDAITGGRLRNDVYPALETRTLPNEALLQPRLTRTDAIEKARSVLRKYISFHYPTYMLMSGMPDTEILQENMAFGLYWLVPETADERSSSTVSIVNSISGEVIEERIQTDRISQSDLA